MRRRRPHRRRMLGPAAALAAGLACGPRPAPPPPPPLDRVTQEDCEQVVERLRRVMPGAMGATAAEDVEECLAMPVALVRCLAKVEAPRHADACVDQYLGPPSRGDCEDIVRHLRSLDPGFASDSGEEAADHCVAHKSRSELACIREASTIEEARSCERP